MVATIGTTMASTPSTTRTMPSMRNSTQCSRTDRATACPNRSMPLVSIAMCDLLNVDLPTPERQHASFNIPARKSGTTAPDSVADFLRHARQGSLSGHPSGGLPELAREAPLRASPLPPTWGPRTGPSEVRGVKHEARRGGRRGLAWGAVGGSPHSFNFVHERRSQPDTSGCNLTIKHGPSLSRPDVVGWREYRG